MPVIGTVGERLRPVALETQPRVSVVIPCYNYGRYLPEAVRSALTGQDGVDVDVLIVDDASPDGSGDVARALAETDDRVSVLQHRTNAGHIRTYNDGLSAVTGDYAVLLSADDQLAAGALPRAAALLERHPEVGFTYGWAQMFDGDRPVVRDRAVRSWTRWRGEQWLHALARRGANRIVNPEVMMRRSLLSDLGYYRADLPHSADLHLWLQAAAHADVARINGPDLAYYRVHAQNMHLTAFAGALTDLRERRRTYELVLPAASSRAVLDLAHEALAREALDVAADALDRGVPELVPVEDHLAFAVETWPAIVSSGAWSRIHRRLGAERPAWWMRGSAVRRDVWHRLRWRWWRRTGM